MNITIIGNGNLAYNLAAAFNSKGIEISKIIGRDIEKAKVIANKVGSEFGDFTMEFADNDIFFLCVSDNSLEQVAVLLKNRFLVHCSGAININVLSRYCSNYGVFYPLYTFNKSEIADFSKIPILVEASNNQNLTTLHSIAEKISKNISIIDSEERLKLHLAAVFSNNFVNHIFAITKNFLLENNLNFDLLLPIIEKTLSIQNITNAFNNQTGPAIRKDFKTIESHRLLLENKNLTKQVYDILTNSIISMHNRNNDEGKK